MSDTPRLPQLNDQFDPALIPGRGPVLLNGPFTVEWDGAPVAVGHTLRIDGDVAGCLRWHDGLRWHYVDQGALTGIRAVKDQAVYRDELGRTHTFRPLQLADAGMLSPRPAAETLPGLLRAITAIWKPGTWV